MSNTTNEKRLVSHDGGEAFVCRDCMELIDLVGSTYEGYTKEQADNAECPHCGGTDTAYSFADPITADDCWLDKKQGEDKDDHAFGFVGTEAEYIDEDGESQEYAGWFFTWPGQSAKVTTQEEMDAVIASLDIDETASGDPIPHEIAVEKLTAMLEKNLAKNMSDDV